MKKTCEIIHVSLENQFPKHQCNDISHYIINLHMFISICSSQDVDAYGLMGCVYIQWRSPTTHKWGNPSLILRVTKNIDVSKQNMGMANQVVNNILALGPKHEK